MRLAVAIVGITISMAAGLLTGCASDYSGYTVKDLCIFRQSYSSWEIDQNAVSRELVKRGVSDCSEFNEDIKQAIKQRQEEAELRRQKQLHGDPGNKSSQKSPFL